MFKNIVKIKKEGENFLIFSSEGMLLELTPEEYSIFNTLGKEKKIDPKNKDFLSQLASYGLLEFEDFITVEREKKYDLSLMNHNSDTPIYPAPVLAHLAITNRCNMACKYCSVRKLHKKMPDKELSTKEWKSVITRLADWGVFQIGFTGGEPTLRKDLPELASHVYKCGCVFNLTTNGWFLDENLVKKLAEGGMKQCQISLDSHIKEVHEKLRGLDSFGRVIKSINLLKKHGIAVGIDCVITKNNIKSIPEFINWISKEKIPYLTLIKLKKGDLSDEDFKNLSVDYIEYSNLIKNICSRDKNANPNITLDCGSVSNLQAVTKKENFLNLPVSGCPIGHHLICISPDGGIYPCAALLNQKFNLGNIIKEDISKIWKENNTLKKFRLIKKNITGKCKNCERLDFCRGGCRGIVYSKLGNIKESDPTCQFNELNNREVK